MVTFFNGTDRLNLLPLPATTDFPLVITDWVNNFTGSSS
ncbi:hypothetical protein SAMN05216167_113144 [Spirosoma endophyticum]|uniref:Uncharacterized protein n=1 Tax=Spirosoma endophyticum TaxID=662367 RepID=A0A1I2ACD5_9BACT|nr:hypothetical protein SAMN05216167_113144 [Spirosoma endophyticum]